MMSKYWQKRQFLKIYITIIIEICIITKIGSWREIEHQTYKKTKNRKNWQIILTRMS